MKNRDGTTIPMSIQRAFYKHAPPPAPRIAPLELAQLLSVKCSVDRTLDACAAFETVAAAVPRLQLADGSAVTDVYQAQKFFQELCKLIDPKI